MKVNRRSRPRPATSRLILFNKPFGVLTQFSGQPGDSTLAEFIPIKDVYPAGRLDKDSEGLLLLTNDGRLQARISDPAYKLKKVYYAQVEGIPDDQALAALRAGVQLNDGMTRPAEVERSMQPDWLWSRNPPVRFRKNVADSWLRLTISEGRNRQVRRMTAHVGHPTLRLVRYQVGNWTLSGLATGEYSEVKAERPAGMAPKGRK